MTGDLQDLGEAEGTPYEGKGTGTKMHIENVNILLEFV